MGRIGYLTRLGGQCALIIRDFHSQSSAVYTKEPANRPDLRGHSLHIYAGDGQNGGFTELETSARSTEPGRPSTDTAYLWAYRGQRGALLRIASQLLGIDAQTFVRAFQ